MKEELHLVEADWFANGLQSQQKQHSAHEKASFANYQLADQWNHAHQWSLAHIHYIYVRISTRGR